MCPPYYLCLEDQDGGQYCAGGGDDDVMCDGDDVRRGGCGGEGRRGSGQVQPSWGYDAWSSAAESATRHTAAGDVGGRSHCVIGVGGEVGDVLLSSLLYQHVPVQHSQPLTKQHKTILTSGWTLTLYIRRDTHHSEL